MNEKPKIPISKRDLPMLTTIKCPICGANVVVEDIDEWETETGNATESGFHINCSAEPDINSDIWKSWFYRHWPTHYTCWKHLEIEIRKAFNRKFKYTGE